MAKPKRPNIAGALTGGKGVSNYLGGAGMKPPADSDSPSPPVVNEEVATQATPDTMELNQAVVEQEEPSPERTRRLKRSARKEKEQMIADTIYFRPDIYEQLRRAWMEQKVSDPSAKKWHIVNDALELYFAQQR